MAGFDLETKKVAIFDWLALACPGVPVIRQEQSERRPPEPYIAFKFFDVVEALGAFDSLKYDQSQTSFKVSGHRTATVEVEVVGPNAGGIGLTVQQSVELQGAKDILCAAGLVVVQNPSLVDNTVLLETEFEERAILEMTIGFIVETIDTVEAIEQAEVTGTLSDKNVEVSKCQ